MHHLKSQRRDCLEERCTFLVPLWRVSRQIPEQVLFFQTRDSQQYGEQLKIPFPSTDYEGKKALRDLVHGKVRNNWVLVANALLAIVSFRDSCKRSNKQSQRFPVSQEPSISGLDFLSRILVLRRFLWNLPFFLLQIT